MPPLFQEPAFGLISAARVLWPHIVSRLKSRGIESGRRGVERAAIKGFFYVLRQK